MEPDEPQELLSRRLGANVKTLRERKSMSQADLAEAMNKRGWKWHQNTVYRVENGKQMVRLDEAATLARALGTSLDRLTWPSAEASATEYVYGAGQRAQAAYETVATAVHQFLADFAHAEAALDQTEGHTSPRIQEARRDLEGKLLECGLDQAVAEGQRRYTETTGGEEGEA